MYSHLQQVGYQQAAVRPFDSMYQALSRDFTIEQLSHFVEWFSGDVLDSIWTQTNGTGTNTFVMADVVDEGFSIQTGTGASDGGWISFNDINHYAHNASIVNVVMKTLELSNEFTLAGLTEQTSSPFNTRASFRSIGTDTNYTLQTSLNGSHTATSTGVAIDTNFHHGKVELRTASALLHVDGILEAISTTNLPDVALQPYFRKGSQTTTGGKEGRIRYLEAYNT